MPRRTQSPDINRNQLTTVLKFIDSNNKIITMRKRPFYAIIILIAISCNQAVKQSDNKNSIRKETVYHCAPITSDKDWYSSGTKAPMFKGLEGIDFKISTVSKKAQEYFNQGMMLSYGFNHAEAARSFFEATKLDPACAMAYWGFAYVLGPNYNAGMEKDNYERAYAATQKALSLSATCTEKEKELIKALTYRYTAKTPEDRHPLDSAFSSAMKKVYEKYPSDPDIGALFAESLMDMHPWDL